MLRREAFPEDEPAQVNSCQIMISNIKILITLVRLVGFQTPSLFASSVSCPERSSNGNSNSNSSVLQSGCHEYSVTTIVKVWVEPAVGCKGSPPWLLPGPCFLAIRSPPSPSSFLLCCNDQWPIIKRGSGRREFPVCSLRDQLKSPSPRRGSCWEGSVGQVLVRRSKLRGFKM